MYTQDSLIRMKSVATAVAAGGAGSTSCQCLRPRSSWAAPVLLAPGVRYLATPCVLTATPSWVAPVLPAHCVSLTLVTLCVLVYGLWRSLCMRPCRTNSNATGRRKGVRHVPTVHKKPNYLRKHHFSASTASLLLALHRRYGACRRPPVPKVATAPLLLQQEAPIAALVPSGPLINTAPLGSSMPPSPASTVHTVSTARRFTVYTVKSPINLHVPPLFRVVSPRPSLSLPLSSFSCSSHKILLIE